jgi:hypothetical protein
LTGCHSWGVESVFNVTQEGSHIILQVATPRHLHPAVPNHYPLRLGTLNAILRPRMAARSSSSVRAAGLPSRNFSRGRLCSGRSLMVLTSSDVRNVAMPFGEPPPHGIGPKRPDIWPDSQLAAKEATNRAALALQAAEVEGVLPIKRAEVLEGQGVNIDFGHG